MAMKSVLLASTVLFSFANPAFSADKEVYETNTKIEKNAKGDFKEKTKTTKTEMDGTFSSYEKQVDIDVDDKGNTTKTTTTETIIDPKGLGNKHITKTKDTEKTVNGEVSTTHEATVNGKDVQLDSSFEKDSKGNYERKDTITRTDPAGTTRSYEKKVDIETDSSGNTKKTTTTESGIDPRGLGNKDRVKTTDTEQAPGPVTNPAH